MGFLTKTRQETGADRPKFGGGGSWVDVDAMVARENVFAITNIEWDGENEYNGTPRPRWVLDIIPWYEGETLPGKAGEDGRLTQLDAGKLGLASHVSRDPLMNSIMDEFEADDSEEIVDGVFNSPGVLVKIRVPGGKGGKYIDLCEWDEEGERPILSQGAEIAPAEDDEPRRPTGRSAPARGGRQQPQGRQRQPERGPEPEPDPPARSRRTRSSGGSEAETTTGSTRSGGRTRGSSASSAPAGDSGFAGAGGAESDGGAVARAVPAPAGLPISAADLKIVSDVVGGDPYTESELADEYELDEGIAFPGSRKEGNRTLTGIKKWLYDHGIDDFPEGRGKIKPVYRDAYSIALRAWMEATGRDANGDPAQEPPAEPEYTPGGPDHMTGYNSGENAQPRPTRTVRPADIPENAHAADAAKHPATMGREGGEQQPVRPDQKAAWMPPDQRERGQQPASEHVYEPGDVGDSIEPCPSCQVVVTGRAHPSGAGSYGIVHECPTSGATIPLQATNIRKG